MYFILKESIEKCQDCMLAIRVSKDQQAARANKNASILLEELDMEKTKEELKKASAARRKMKKKKKKQAKSGKKLEEETEDKNNEQENEEDEEEDEDEEEEVPVKGRKSIKYIYISLCNIQCLERSLSI